MLDKLRRREDVAAAVLRKPLPRPYDADRTLDAAIDRILDLELAIMLHTYREDLIAQ